MPRPYIPLPEDIPSAPIGPGVHGVRFAPSDLRAVSQLRFARFLPGGDRREGTDHVISIGHAP